MYESIKKDAKKVIGSLSLGVLLMLSIATSIDALAVGLSLSFLKVSIVAPAIATGLITFSLSFLGMYLGSRFGRFLKNKIEVLGGIILIIIGVNILIEHLWTYLRRGCEVTYTFLVVSSEVRFVPTTAENF